MTLKVSTIETTAETADATGGWGLKRMAPTLKNLSNCWNTLKPICYSRVKALRML